MRSTTNKTAPAAASGQSKTIIAMFFNDMGGEQLFHFTLTPALRSRARAAMKAAKKIDAVVRVQFPDKNVREVDFDALPAAAAKRLGSMGISPEDFGCLQDESIEFSIPKKALKPTPERPEGGYFIEVGGAGWAQLLAYGSDSPFSFSSAFAPLDAELLK